MKSYYLPKAGKGSNRYWLLKPDNRFFPRITFPWRNNRTQNITYFIQTFLTLQGRDYCNYAPTKVESLCSKQELLAWESPFKEKLPTPTIQYLVMWSEIIHLINWLILCRKPCIYFLRFQIFSKWGSLDSKFEAILY